MYRHSGLPTQSNSVVYMKSLEADLTWWRGWITLLSDTLAMNTRHNGIKYTNTQIYINFEKNIFPTFTHTLHRGEILRRCKIFSEYTLSTHLIREKELIIQPIQKIQYLVIWNLNNIFACEIDGGNVSDIYASTMGTFERGI